MNDRNNSSLSPSKRLAEIEEMCRAKDEVIRHLQRDLEQQVWDVRSFDEYIFAARWPWYLVFDEIFARKN